MKIPKQKFVFVNTMKNTPHTEDEMRFVCENQNFLDVESWKSIKDKNNYYVQLVGWSYDVETIDYPDGTVFNNATHFDFERNDYGK